MKTKKIPMRKCVGCNTSKPKRELIRIACYDGEIKVDLTGKANGRGIYICRNEECLKQAIKRKSVFRAFGRELTEEDKAEILKEIAKK